MLVILSCHIGMRGGKFCIDEENQCSDIVTYILANIFVDGRHWPLSIYIQDCDNDRDVSSTDDSQSTKAKKKLLTRLFEIHIVRYRPCMFPTKRKQGSAWLHWRRQRQQSIVRDMMTDRKC